MIEFTQLTRRTQIKRLRVLARHALAQYGLQPATLALLGHFDNTTFAVTAQDGSRYLLRIHRPDKDPTHTARRRTRIESEQWWLDRLRADLHLPVPVAVRTPSGDGVVEMTVEGVSGSRFCTLFHWMDGRFLSSRLAGTHLEGVGRLTARLHNHSARLTVPAEFDRQRVDRADGDTEERAARLFADHWSLGAAAVMRDIFRRVRDVQGELGSGPDTYGLIHADIHQWNYMFCGGEVRLIDFDDCGWGHYLYDLAVTLQQINDHPRIGTLREALLAGYRQERDLSAAQERAIDTFRMLREAQDITFFMRERDNPAFEKWTSQIGERVMILERFLTRT
jgi:Ser/Thr protein kinase RdoA (MazF antagonist)